MPKYTIKSFHQHRIVLHHDINIRRMQLYQLESDSKPFLHGILL